MCSLLMDLERSMKEFALHDRMRYYEETKGVEHRDDSRKSEVHFIDTGLLSTYMLLNYSVKIEVGIN
jgi:hypothetical protein